ncbi:ubiquitin carboxyl-terminal hydrolase 47-like isoform X1 [Tachysurus ichikawai]
MSSRQDSEPGLFGADECKQAGYNNLPQTLEQECSVVKPDASVEDELCDPMLGQLSRLEVDLMGKQMQDYR